MSDVQLAAITKQLEDLSDLFRRRLLDDRSARVVREVLEKRVADLESALRSDEVKPTVRAIAQVIDRLDDNRVEHGAFAESITEELMDVLLGLGVTEVGTTADFDPRRHGIASVAGGEGGSLRIVEVVRRGWETQNAVMRPASVVVERITHPDGELADSGAG